MLVATEFSPVTRFDLARTIAGRGRYWTTAYQVDGLLIDSGCAHCADAFAARLTCEHLETIVNTHTHEDHIGANGVLQRHRPEIQIRAHPLAVPVLNDPVGRQPLHPYRRIMWGWPTPCSAGPLAHNDRVETDRYSFTVLHTPGHSADHLCLYEEREGWLFTGDLYVGGRDRAIRAGSDIWQIISCLKRLKELDISTMFPGSARVPPSPDQALNAKIDYLEELGERVTKHRDSGWSVSRIARTLCGGPMWVEIFTLGHFSRRNLVRSFLGINNDDS